VRCLLHCWERKLGKTRGWVSVRYGPLPLLVVDLSVLAYCVTETIAAFVPSSVHVLLGTFIVHPVIVKRLAMCLDQHWHYSGKELGSLCIALLLSRHGPGPAVQLGHHDG
jgi:hypothetical protein